MTCTDAESITAAQSPEAFRRTVQSVRGDYLATRRLAGIWASGSCVLGGLQSITASVGCRCVGCHLTSPPGTSRQVHYSQ